MQKPGRIRADALLVERGIAESRAQAQALIMAGKVSTGERRIEKPGTLLSLDTPLTVAMPSKFVSRGGDKLEGALLHFRDCGLTVEGSVCADIGASTGGFTDCLLQHGARLVYAIDVGYGQLATKLRNDPRVVSIERCNARGLTASDLPQPIDLITVDASFISLSKLLDAIERLLRHGGLLVALIKPQFEAGRAAVSKGKGVVRDDDRDVAIASVRDAIERHGFSIVSETDSTVHGPKGNVERFVFARKP